MIRRAPIALADQVITRLEKPLKKKPQFTGNETMVSTGSTLLDLAISGGRFPNGGIPGGILVEIFGPASAGKTVLLCEIAGGVQRLGGQVMFRDPEARLNKQFAELFGFQVETALYDTPSTVTELFAPIRKWEPVGVAEGTIHAVFADSLAALSTEMELDDQDKFGMRRAKEFSEECRKICRILTQRNILLVCSNQVRQNIDAGPYGERFKSPGGEAIGFYASLRLRCHNPHKINKEKNIGRGSQKRVIGVETTVEVYKSSVWEPYRSAPVTIIYGYGVDDVRANLDYVKTITGDTVYQLGDKKLGPGIDKAIKIVEEDGLEAALKESVVAHWRDTEAKFATTRQPKRRV